jgi:hypothetical protein
VDVAAPIEARRSQHICDEGPKYYREGRPALQVLRRRSSSFECFEHSSAQRRSPTRLFGLAGQKTVEPCETVAVSELDGWPVSRGPSPLGRFEVERLGDQDRTDVDLHKDRGLDLTPAERLRRRSNRRWMVGLAVGSILLLGAALLVSAIETSREPNGPSISAPAGYQVVKDGYFSYVVPKSWSTNQAYTDQAGDVDTSGTSGWAGQHIDYLLHAPTLQATPPAALQAFGQPAPSPFTLTQGHEITVKGASVAFEYRASRPGGFHAVVVHAWSSATDVELWLMVDAPAAQSSVILNSLAA